MRNVLLLCLLLLPLLSAARDFSLSEPVAIVNPEKTMELWTQFDYIDENLDFFDFQNQEVSNTFRLSDEKTGHLGINWKINSDYAFRLSALIRIADITRSVEPFSLEGKQSSGSVAVQRLFGHSALEVKLNYFAVKDLVIDKFLVTGGIILGQDILLLDPDTLSPFPVGKIGMKENGAEIGYFKNLPGPGVSYDFSANYRYSKVQPEVSSVLFRVTDPTFLNSTVNGRVVGDVIQQFRDTLPQNSAWKEHIFSASAALNIPLGEKWSTTWSLRGYAISRKDYEKGPDEDEVKKNLVLSGYLQWSPSRAFTLYFKGMIYSNYLAGSHPGIYNRRVSRLFHNAYGTFSIGAVYQF